MAQDSQVDEKKYFNQVVDNAKKGFLATIRDIPRDELLQASIDIVSPFSDRKASELKAEQNDIKEKEEASIIKDAVVDKRTRAQIKILRYNLEQELYGVASEIKKIKENYADPKSLAGLQSRENLIQDAAKLDILAEEQRRLVKNLDKITNTTGQQNTKTMRMQDMDVYKELKKQNEQLYDSLPENKRSEMLPNSLYAQKLIATPYSNNVFGGHETGKVSQKRIDRIKEYGGEASDVEKAKNRKEFSTNNIVKGGAISDVIGEVRIYKDSATFNDSINNIRQNIIKTAQIKADSYYSLSKSDKVKMTEEEKKQYFVGKDNDPYKLLGGYVGNDGKRDVKLDENSEFMKKKAELVKAAGIEEVKDKTSLYAKYGMLPDGKTNEYEGLLSAKEGEQKLTPVKLEHGIKEYIKESVTMGKNQSGELTTKSIDESSVVKDLMPKAKEMLATKKNGESVTIVSYKFNPLTGQLDPSTPQAAATFTKDADGKITGEKVTPSKANDKDLNEALIKAQKQALLANVEGSKHSQEIKEQLKTNIEDKFKINQDSQQPQPLNEKDFKEFSQQIKEGNLAEKVAPVKVEIVAENKQNDIQKLNQQKTTTIKKDDSSEKALTGQNTTVSNLATRSSSLSRQLSNVSTLSQQSNTASVTSGKANLAEAKEVLKKGITKVITKTTQASTNSLSSFKQSDHVRSSSTAGDLMTSFKKSTSPATSTKTKIPLSAVAVQGTGVSQRIQ